LDSGWPGHKLPSCRMKSIQALCIAIVAGAAVAEDPRPSLEEHKAAKQAEKDDAAAAAAREAKMAAVNKVITMLEDLQSQVLAEGEKEAATYNDFACFCKDGTKEKSAAIETGEDDKSSISSTIGDLSEKRDELDANIEDLTRDLEEAEGELKKASDERHATLAVFEKNNNDLTGALEALDGAIEVIKSSKSSLLQLQSAKKTARSAAMLADALGLGQSSAQQRQVVAFLQQPEVEMEGYKFHSQSVVATLEDLKKDFRTELQGIDADEVKSVAEFQAFKQEKLDHIKSKEKELADTKEIKDKTTKEISMNSAELTTVAADLLDNQQYLKELAEMCSSRAKTWDQRSKVRADELSALTAATAIIKSGVKENTSAASVRLVQQGVSVSMARDVVNNDDAMEAIEAAAEGSEAIGFLQRRMEKPSALIAVLAKQHVAQDDSRQLVVNLLTTQGNKLKSTLLLSLANQIKADPFAKIKKLIQDLIERLLSEAADEANQKGWCDKAQAEAKQKRTYSAEAIAELNGQMAELEAVHDKLTEELSTLETEIAALNSAQEENSKLRKEEKSENEATVLEATAGLEAVNQAIDILDKFYKTAAKEKVDLGLVQGPMDDAPDAGFGEGEAYTGAGGESGGILGMLDVIKSDFERTVSATQKAEAAAETEYQTFMTESSKSLAEKTMAEEQKSKQKDDAAEEYESAEEDLAAQTTLLKTGIKELIELKPACEVKPMSYEERVARREDEIESLKKALCTLQNQGPDGDGGSC